MSAPSPAARGPLGDVLLTEAERQQIRELLRRDGTALEVARACIATPARNACARPLHIPAPHDTRMPQYHDPQTGEPLQFERDRPQEHRSPTGKLFRGPEYDRAWTNIQHNLNANDARNCALAAALLDDQDAGRHARQLLLGYAGVYLDHVPNGRLSCTWGRLFSQALEEAVWSISMLWTTELLHKANLLDEAELDLLRVRLFEPIVDLLWGEWYFIHNIRMWCNAAIGSIGLAFHERPAIRHAITGDKGFRQQLIDGFRSDGLLYEGSPGYHDYAISAMLILAEAMARNGYAPYRDDHLRHAMLVSAAMTQPDGSLPRLNDYGMSRGLATRNFATALRRYDDDEVRQVAAAAFAQWLEQGCAADFTTADWNRTPAYHARQQIDWFLAWDRLDQTRKHRPRRVVELRASGIGILRPEPDSYLLLKCSGKGSGHDHHDKLSFIWWHHGRCWFADPGTTAYALPLHEQWFKSTLAHQTAAVDGVRHERTDAALVECQPAVLAGRAQPYPTLMPDVRMSRRLCLVSAGNLLDELQVRADHARVVDYVLTPGGEFQPPDGLRQTPAGLEGADPAYQVLRDVKRLELDQTGCLEWMQNDDRLRISLSSVSPTTELYLAKAPADATNLERCGDALVLRQRGRHVTFQLHFTVEVGVPLAPARLGRADSTPQSVAY